MRARYQSIMARTRSWSPGDESRPWDDLLRDNFLTHEPTNPFSPESVASKVVVITEPGVAGALIGAWIALGLEAELLRRLFGLFLLVVAARMAWRAYRLTDRSEPAPDPS